MPTVRIRAPIQPRTSRAQAAAPRPDWALCAGPLPTCQDHVPAPDYENGRLYCLSTFLEGLRAADRQLPRYVEQELRAYLECDILAHGFLWLRLHRAHQILDNAACLCYFRKATTRRRWMLLRQSLD